MKASALFKVGCNSLDEALKMVSDFYNENGNIIWEMSYAVCPATKEWSTKKVDVDPWIEDAEEQKKVQEEDQIELDFKAQSMISETEVAYQAWERIFSDFGLAGLCRIGFPDDDELDALQDFRKIQLSDMPCHFISSMIASIQKQIGDLSTTPSEGLADMAKATVFRQARVLEAFYTDFCRPSLAENLPFISNQDPRFSLCHFLGDSKKKIFYICAIQTY